MGFDRVFKNPLKRRRRKDADLKTRLNRDSEKVVVAVRLRAETTLTVGWVAQRLNRGHAGI